MPHKRNPIITERLTGFARLLRSNSMAAMENVALWHERDISHSSVERIIIPDSTTLMDYMLIRMHDLIDNLIVYPDRMIENIHCQKGLVMAEKVMISLVDAGVSRDEAHEVLREASMTSIESGEELIDVCSRTPEIAAAFTADELERLFDPMNHLGVSGELIDEAVALARKAISE